MYSSVGVEIDDHKDEWLGKLSDKQKLYSQKGVVVGFVKKDDIDQVRGVNFDMIDWKSKTDRSVVESSFQGETHAAFFGHDMGHLLRVLFAEIMIGKEVLKWNDDVSWNVFRKLVLCTDCKSVFDAVHKAQQSIGDRSVALCISVLRQLATTTPSDDCKAIMMWIPTRHQVADGLTKPSTGILLRQFLKEGLVRFHGRSATELRDENPKRDFHEC